MSDQAFDFYKSIEYFIPLFLFIFGAILGSFANVIIHRWPKGESIVSPRSRCPTCGKPVRFYDNIPILSWLILKGKCRDCGAKISLQYPIVELVMALVFVVIHHQVGVSWSLLEYLIMAFGLVTASFIDLDHYLLPDVITLPSLVIGLIGGFLNPDRSFLDSVMGVLVGGGFLWSIAYIYQLLRKEEGMGGGDIKLLAWVGAVLGWKAIPFIIISASLVGSIFGLLIAGRKGKGIKTVIPFGPYLAGAALLYVCGGEEIGNWYIQLFIPALQ